MTIKEFIQNYNLHDSLLEGIDYDEKAATVKLYVDFCYWQQDGYTDEMPETGNIVIKFSKCADFQYSSYRINSDEISKVVSNNENEIVLTVFNDLSGKYIEIKIEASAVSVQTC